MKETLHILAAILIFTLVAAFSSLLQGNLAHLAIAFLFTTLIILVNIVTKKGTASLLDANVEHEIWSFSQFGLKPQHHLKNPLPLGIILPLFFSLISLGILKIPSLLTYETTPLKRRAAKRFEYYSYSQMTDWHNALIGASGIIAVLLLSIIAYFLPYNLETLAKLGVYYALVNLIPLSKLDGTQIFFGSRVIYTILLFTTLIATALTITVS